MLQEILTLNDFYKISLTHIKGYILPSFWDVAPHSHDHCEIFIHIAGRLDVFVEQNVYQLYGNEIRLYRSGELHRGKIDITQDMEWYQISIPRLFFENEENQGLSPVLFDRKPGENNMFISSKTEEMVFLLNEVFEEYRAENPLLEHYGKSAVIKILCLLNDKSKNIPARTLESEALRKLLNTINSDFKSICTVEDLCNHTHYSASYINRLFKLHLGVAPYQFITAKKLNEAKKLLISGVGVTAACEYAGFNNYNNFITLFKKHFGITPKKYQSRGKTQTDKA